jgi:hypothetical protein
MCLDRYHVNPDTAVFVFRGYRNHNKEGFSFCLAIHSVDHWQPDGPQDGVEAVTLSSFWGPPHRLLPINLHHIIVINAILHAVHFVWANDDT